MSGRTHNNEGVFSIALHYGIDAGDRTSRRWALGEDEVPRAVAIALTLMIEHNVGASRFMP